MEYLRIELLFDGVGGCFVCPARPEEGRAAPGCAGSSGTAPSIIHLPNFGVPRHTPGAAARCLGFSEVAAIIFFLKIGVLVVFERLSGLPGWQVGCRAG